MSLHRKQRVLGKLVWITKSNSSRRTAKEKGDDLQKTLRTKIANVVDELKKT